MVITLVLPILVLLIGGFLSLIVFAIVRKKWALLFIPLGVFAVLAVAAFIGYFYLMPTVAEYEYNYPYSDVGQASNNTAGVSEYSVNVARPIDAGGYGRAVQVNASDAGAVIDSASGNSVQGAEYNRNTSVKVTRHQPFGSVGHSATNLWMFTMLAVITFVVLFVIAIVQKKWAVLLVPLGVGVVAVLGLFGVRSGHMSGQPRTIAEVNPAYQVAQPAAGDKPLPDVWSAGIEKEFTADVYYSKTTAFRGVARYLERMFAHDTRYSKPVPEKFALLTYKDEFSKELIDEAISIFKYTMPDTELYHVSAGTASKDSELFNEHKDNWISLRLNESPGHPVNIRLNGASVNSYPKLEDFKSGTIKVHINLNYSQGNYSFKYTEKPWLENFSAFQNSIPQRQFSIAYSQTSCNSSDWAVRQAVSQAQQVVNKMILDIHRSMPKSRRSRAGFSLSRDDLYSHGIVIDNISQSFRGNTGFNRHALLLDISPDRIMPLAEKKINEYNSARRSWAYHIFSAIGIVIVICVIYLILNAATRGYYTVVLRILTAVGIIAAVLLLMSVA